MQENEDGSLRIVTALAILPTAGDNAIRSPAFRNSILDFRLETLDSGLWLLVIGHAWFTTETQRPPQ